MRSEVAIRASSGMDVNGDRTPAESTALDVGQPPLTYLLEHFGPFLLVAGAIAGVGVAAALGQKMAMAGLVGVTAALVLLHRPALGGLALALVVPVIPGLARGVPVPGLRLSEVLTAGIAAVVLLSPGRYRSPRWGAFDWLAIAYVVTTLGLGSFDLLRRGAPFTSDNTGKLLGPLQFFLLYRAVVATLHTPRLRSMALRLVLVASVPMSALAVAQELNIGPVRHTIVRLTESSALTGYSFATLARATGLFAAWHDLAGYLFVILLIAAALWFRPGQDVLSRRDLAIVIGAASIAIVATLTMVAVIAAIAGALILGARHGYGARVTAWLATAAVVGFVIFGSFVGARFSAQFSHAQTIGAQHAYKGLVPQTIRYRISVWTDQYFPAMAGRFATGYGPDIPPEVTWHFTESLYITLLLRGGLPLLAVYLALMLAAYSGAHRRIGFGTPVDQATAEVVVLIVVLLFFMQLINPYFTDAGLPHLLWLLFGMVFSRPAPTAADLAPAGLPAELP